MASPIVIRLLPPRPECSDARRRLYETALVLFGDRGFHAVSVRDIANTLGQQPGALYAHVPSKEHLLYELVQLGQEEHASHIKAAILDAGRDPADQVRALVRAHVMSHLEYPSLARVVNRESRSLSDEHYAEFVRNRQELEQLFLDVVERGVALGEFNPTDATLAVTAIGSMGVRAAEWWDPDTSPSPEHIGETYADFAVRLLS